jgi:RND family efflux transporter MFP subunit
MSNHSASENSRKPLIAAAAIGGLLLVIFIALGIIGGESKTKPGNTELGQTTLPDPSSLLRVGKQLAGNDLAWQGTIRSRLAVKIAPKLNARIIEIPVHPGSVVKKGQVLAKLDDRDLRAAFNAANAAQMAAKAQAQQANSEEQRITGLYNQQAATRQNYEAVLAQAQAARAMANQAASNAQQSQVMLAENVLTAPFDGVVGERYQEPGDMGMVNQPIVSFYQPDDLRLEAAIASQCLSQIKLGMEVTVKLDESAESLIGNIDEIAPDLDPQTHTRLLKVKLPKNSKLQHGQFAWLQLSCQAEQNTLLIPNSAIIHYGQLQAVKVIENQQIQIRHIRTGKQIGDQLEVLSGLHDGETIVRDAGVAP